MKGGALAAIALAAALVWWSMQQEGDVQKLADKLIDALPSRLGQWGAQLARAASTTSPVAIPPLKWGLFLAAVMDRESNGGSQLRPTGPGGFGDWSARRGSWLNRDDVAQQVDAAPAGWAAPRDASGATLTGPYAIPLDGKGWGRGLMQQDLGSHPELLGETPTAEASINTAAAELRSLFLQLAGDMDQDERFQRTADAYNAGPRALTHPNPDSITTGHNYGSDVLARAAGFEEAIA